MKNKLIAAMFLFTIQINGMENIQILKETSDNFLQFSMDEDYEEGDCSPKDRVNELDEYYQSQSKIKGNKALQDLNEVFDENDRKSFFEKLVLNVNNITNDAALLKFICAAAQTIIKSPEYNCDEDSYDPMCDSPEYVYKPPFLYTLIENLDPVTRNYMRRVAKSSRE